VLRVERHGEASRDHRTNAALDPPSHPFANGIGSNMGPFNNHECPALALVRPIGALMNEHLGSS
jgi:hypothetical protein